MTITMSNQGGGQIQNKFNIPLKFTNKITFLTH